MCDASDVVRTTCAYCGVGCGIRATVTGDRAVRIEGDPDHPANHGRLCSKGTHLGETVGLEGRLLHPMIGRKRASWDKALDLVARKFQEAIAQHGPNSVAFYVSGQLLTEDYYVANKLMKGFIGSANIDTNSRLCMSSAVAGHVRAFGEDVVPASYDDLDTADLIVLVGSNTAWCHPVVYQRIRARCDAGAKLVVIDPRRTETADEADLHLAIRPGSDIALMNGALAWCRDAGALPLINARRVNSPATAGRNPACPPSARNTAAITARPP
jgi:assimilatory nitrate reductase catalytic subunit